MTRESLDIINELVAHQVPMPQVINNQNLKAAKRYFDRSRTSRSGGIPPNSAAAKIQKEYTPPGSTEVLNLYSVAIIRELKEQGWPLPAVISNASLKTE